jgi:hypothetical protein
MRPIGRRSFLRRTLAAGAALGAVPASHVFAAPHDEIQRGPYATQHESVRVLNPRGRVPLSFIIDDSTCLVNMGHFCMPQFAEAWPEREEYRLPWTTWPREIPDSFVREFGEWCRGEGVKGKYSVVPYPACVGWLDRELPGWSRRQLQESLQLVRDLLLPDWDIHPEMITHTRVIDLATGRPHEQISAATMENSYPREEKSVDELAAYLAYALRILKNCDLPCEGITTPGGFGNLVKPKLSQAVFESVRDVYGSEIPHYFKYVVDSGESSAPQLEHVSGLGTDDVRVTVNVVAGTGDWFGGWEGVQTPQPDLYATVDGQAGRMIEMIRAGEPAVFLCHWPGMYSNGSLDGFHAFQRVVRTINAGYRDVTRWMKLSEIARYWAAKGLTAIARNGRELTLEAPFAAPGLTLEITGAAETPPGVVTQDGVRPLTEVHEFSELREGTWIRRDAALVVCFDLPPGRTTLRV